MRQTSGTKGSDKEQRHFLWIRPEDSSFAPAQVIVDSRIAFFLKKLSNSRQNWHASGSRALCQAQQIIEPSHPKGPWDSQSKERLEPSHGSHNHSDDTPPFDPWVVRPSILGTRRNHPSHPTPNHEATEINIDTFCEWNFCVSVYPGQDTFRFRCRPSNYATNLPWIDLFWRGSCHELSSKFT